MVDICNKSKYIFSVVYVPYTNMQDKQKITCVQIIIKPQYIKLYFYLY